MSKGKIIGITIGSLFLVAGIAVGVFLALRQQQLNSSAAPATSMLITPASQNKNAGDTFSYTVQMDTGTNNSIGFDLVLDFNPQIFQVTSITQGPAITGFQEIRNSIDNATGKIYYSVYNADATKAVHGSGLSILTVSGMVKAGSPAGSYSFTFDSSSAVAGLTEGQNVLILTAPGSVVVGTGGASAATPTATPGHTATPTPTSAGSSSTATPTATPIATATATSSDTSSPSATPTPTSMPIPVTGFDFPTMIMGVVGLGAIVLSIIAMAL
jgi:hypothetical protein